MMSLLNYYLFVDIFIIQNIAVCYEYIYLNLNSCGKDNKWKKHIV